MIQRISHSVRQDSDSTPENAFRLRPMAWALSIALLSPAAVLADNAATSRRGQSRVAGSGGEGRCGE
jgi:hypothetical protein